MTVNEQMTKTVPNNESTQMPEGDCHQLNMRMFEQSEGGSDFTEIENFYVARQMMERDGFYTFEIPRLSPQKNEVVIKNGDNVQKVINFASYNYLGYGHHPEVIQAAKDSLDQYGLGAASTPILSGTLGIHKEFEQQLQDFFNLKDRTVSLFSSGYAVNLGAMSALAKPGDIIVLDQAAHMSLMEGAKLSGAKVAFFRHNNPEHLETVLKKLNPVGKRVLVCVEGVYSADGDFAKLDEIIPVAKRYGAKVLIDEAHSILVAGKNGRGVCEEMGVLDEVDFITITFSKALGGIGGALIADYKVTHYVNWYARCRMFSCALDPAVTGGMTRALQLASSEDGNRKREQIKENARLLRDKLDPIVNIGTTCSWIVPVIFGPDEKALKVSEYFLENGLDTSNLQYPAVPKNLARARMFVTTDHTDDNIETAVQIVKKAAKEFDFLKG